MELLRKETEEVDSEDDGATLSNDDTDDNELSLDIGNEEEYGDPLQADSNSEDEVRSFSMGKAGETIWTTSTLRKRTSRTPQRNIITHLPGARKEARTSQISFYFFELSMSNDII